MFQRGWPKLIFWPWQKKSYFGPLQEFHAAMDPLLLELGRIYSNPPDDIQIRDMGWIDSLTLMSEGKPLLTTPGEHVEHDTFVWLPLFNSASESPILVNTRCHIKRLVSITMVSEGV